jgi:predicted membrane-bound dolichyl-phosphate-mannose-protein mannosyltransferase/Gpi18-like mannosyltransferase
MTMRRLGAGLRRQADLHALALVLLGALVLRLVLAGIVYPHDGFGGDLRDHVGWMQKLAEVGPGGLYASDPSRPLPPGFYWILWPLGLLARALTGTTSASPETLFVLVKLPGIIGDILAAAVLFYVVRAWSSRRTALLAASLFVFVPVTWYESAMWGQVDVLGALLMLAAIVLLIGGWSEGAVVAGVTAAVVKPQFGIVLFVVGIILLRRHVLLVGSGPVPTLRGILARLDERLGGWFTQRQGWERIVSSGVAGVATGAALILPFRMGSMAEGPLARVPTLSDFAGLFALVQREAALFPVLTANAFNPWALVGPEPLASAVGHWTNDSTVQIAGFTAFSFGALLLAAAFVVVGAQLLLRDDRTSILVAVTVLAVAFFVLPTRVHERYLFPAFALAAPLAVMSVGWRAWYLLLAAVCLANLHAILTLPGGLYGTAAMVALPFGDILRSGWAVTLVAITSTGLFAWAVWQTRSAFEPVATRIRAAYRVFDERWPVRDLVPDAGTVLLIVLAVSLLLRAAWLNLPQGALIFDESYYVNAARVILGMHLTPGAHYADAAPFLDPNTEHPPLGKLFMAGSIALFGDNGIGWRVPSVIAGMVALGALYGVVRAAGGRPWLGVLAVTLYSLDVLSFIHGRIGTLDMMSVAFLLVGAWLGLRGQWAWAGAALALGTLVKVPGAYGLVAALLWQGLGLWRAYRQRPLTWNDFTNTAALVGAYAFVGLGGLWLLDLRFTTYSNPLDHINHMLSYGFALQGAFNPTGGITSAPWQWLVNEGQFDYLKTSVNTLANGEVIGSRAIIQFRALLNPALIGAMPLAVLYGVWLAWKRGEALVTWGLLWIAANYLPYWELALLSNRITYFYYILPAVPGLAVLVAAFLIHGRLPRAVVWGFLGVTIVAFIAYFPFRQVP